ncbi:hypothetical protein STEG23_026728 [Scotinomys teguina]
MSALFESSRRGCPAPRMYREQRHLERGKRNREQRIVGHWRTELRSVHCLSPPPTTPTTTPPHQLVSENAYA